MKHLKIFSALILISNIAFSQTLNDALRLTDNEQYDLADAAYRNLIQKEPNNGTLWFYLGENYWKSDNPDSAKLMYEKGLQVEPGNAINLVGVGKALLEEGKQGEARTMFDKALTMSGAKTSMVQSEVAEAFTKSRFKDLSYAMKLLNNAIAVDNKNPELYFLLGDVYAEQNNGTVAAENYNKALDLDKNSVKAIVRKGQLYKRSTNFEGAAEEFKNAIKLSPDFAPAHRELGEVYFKMRKLEDAKQEYKTYLALSKNNTSARLRYTSFLYLSADYPAAQAELNQLSKIDSNNISMMRLMAYVAFETGDYEKAQLYLNKIFEKIEESKLTQLDLEYYAKVLSKNAQDSLAVIYFEKAYLLDTTKTDALRDIGGMYMKLKRYTEAQNAYIRVINYGKGLKVTDYFNTGKAAFFNKDYAVADSMFAKVTELSPSWPNGYLWRAQTNVQLDLDSKKGLAKPHYEKYIEVALADTANTGKYKIGLIESYKYLGGYYFLVDKQTETSKGYWKKVLELDPEDKQAKQVIEGMNQKK